MWQDFVGQFDSIRKLNHVYIQAAMDRERRHGGNRESRNSGPL